MIGALAATTDSVASAGMMIRVPALVKQSVDLLQKQDAVFSQICENDSQ